MFLRLFKIPKSSLQLFRENQAAISSNDAESPQVPTSTFSSLPIIRKVGLALFRCMFFRNPGSFLCTEWCMRKARPSWARLSVRIRYRSARTSEEYVIGRLRPFYVFTQTAARIITKIILYANLIRIKVGGHACGIGKSWLPT